MFCSLGKLYIMLLLSIESVLFCHAPAVCTEQAMQLGLCLLTSV